MEKLVKESHEKALSYKDMQCRLERGLLLLIVERK